MADAFEYKHSSVAKCENCGADMVYEPSMNMLYCSYCKSTREIEKRVSAIRSFDKELKDGEVQFDDTNYKCPNCGGDIKLHPFATAAECPFCGATNVIKQQHIKGLKPDSILPFAISKESATEAGKRWIKRKPFAPHKLKKEFSIANFNGVYIPSFAFSANTFSSYEGRLGENRTRWVGSGKDRHTETYIYWYHVSGVHDFNFYDLPVEASVQIEQKELEKILPYDYDMLEAYNKDYIAGFEAERYDTSLQDSFAVAQDKVEDLIKRQIVAKYHADHIGYLNVDTTYTNKKFRYSLLPLWVCAYKYKNKGYRFLINGRTGKSTGKVPVSPLRVGTVVLAVVGIIALLVWLIASKVLIDDIDDIYLLNQLFMLLK